jgi:hypothetical protein
MKTNKDRRDVVAPATRTNYGRIAVLAGTGIALALVEFICLPMFLPKLVIYPRTIHGELISPPAETNSTTMAGGSPMRRPPSAWSTSAPSGPRANVNTPETIDGHLEIGFDKLASFQVIVIRQMTDPTKFTTVPKLNRPIPGFIKSLDNREIALKGFMLPLKLENARVTEFLLMRSRSFCCFGIPLQVNEWAHVRMKGEGVNSIMDQPIRVYGTLHVGEIIKNGQMSSIYQMDGEKMDEPTFVQ